MIFSLSAAPNCDKIGIVFRKEGDGVPVWGIVLCVAAGLFGLWMLIGWLLFRVACVPRGLANEKQLIQKLEKIAAPELVAAIDEALQQVQALAREDVFVQSADGLRLRARYFAAAPQNKRVLMLFHGWNSYAEFDFSLAIPAFLERGWDLLVVDQRAQNDSEGKYMTFGAWESRDVLAWAQFVVDRCGEDVVIALDGLSMGASTVMLSMGLPLPPQVKGVIADCGFDSAVSEMAHLGRQMHMPTRWILPAMDFWAKRLAHFSFYDTDTAKAIAQSDLPILLAHGTADTFVPPACSQRNAAVCRNLHTFIEAEGAIHGFSYLMATEQYQAALTALFDTICPQTKTHKE